jgi:hypothetical protein
MPVRCEPVLASISSTKIKGVEMKSKSAFTGSAQRYVPEIVVKKPARTWVSDEAWSKLSPRAKFELGMRLDREGNTRPAPVARPRG